MTTIIENQAQHLVVQTDETFYEFADRVHRKSMRPLAYKDGTLIELNPDLEYSFLMLGMERRLTKEEFEAFIEKLEQEKVLPKDIVRTVATPFDIPRSTRPAIPNKFADDIEEGAKIKMYLTGTTSFTLVKEELPDPVEEEIDAA